MTKFSRRHTPRISPQHARQCGNADLVRSAYRGAVELTIEYASGPTTALQLVSSGGSNGNGTQDFSPDWDDS